MKWAGAMLAAWSAAAAAHGDTWADWLAPAANAPVVAEFESGWALESKTAAAYSEAERSVPLNLGYDGSLVFRLAPGAEPPPGPLQVRVSFSVAAPNEMNWPANNDLPDDFVPMVLPQARPRPPVAEDVRRLPPEFPLRVPVVRPWDCRTPISFRTDRPAALFGRYAAFDGAGREVCRGFLPASRLVENRRSLAGLVDADEALKQVTSDLGSLERVRDLPNEMEAYRQIRGIWFTESLWNEVQGRTALLRRLLLSGVRLSGETALVERIRGALGTGRDGAPVYLNDIYPTNQEVEAVINQSLRPEMFSRSYADVYTGSPDWRAIQPAKGELYAWDASSTYIQEPPYFNAMSAEAPAAVAPIRGARALAVLGDSVTTDHISPAGSIPASSPAGKFLLEHGVAQNEFNS